MDARDEDYRTCQKKIWMAQNTWQKVEEAWSALKEETDRD
jgi:hypothetical protein